MYREIRKLIKKVDELQKQLNQQNEYIMDQSIIIHKLIEKLVVIPSYPYPFTPSIDPHFGEGIPYIPCKGPDCETGSNIEYIRNEDSVCGGVRTTTPITYTAYDGTKTILPMNTLPEVTNVQKVNMYGEVIPQYPFDTSS
jgi:hypothetical protein